MSRTDLRETRDHARRMASLEAPVVERVIEDGIPVERITLSVPTDRERALWRQIADEIDRHL